jgi:hypothetical protein
MKIKGVTGAEYEEWKPPEQGHYLMDLQGLEREMMDLQGLERENKSLKETVVHLTTLIQTFGLCRPETQLARMELGEATERYVLNKSYDEKNLGVLAKNLLKEMREKGELPDED